MRQSDTTTKRPYARFVLKITLYVKVSHPLQVPPVLHPSKVRLVVPALKDLEAQMDRARKIVGRIAAPVLNRGLVVQDLCKVFSRTHPCNSDPLCPHPRALRVVPPMATVPTTRVGEIWILTVLEERGI